LEQKEMIDADWIAENGLLEKKSGGQMGVDLAGCGLAILREHRSKLEKILGRRVRPLPVGRPTKKCVKKSKNRKAK